MKVYVEVHPETEAEALVRTSGGAVQAVAGQALGAEERSGSHLAKLIQFLTSSEHVAVGKKVLMKKTIATLMACSMSLQFAYAQNAGDFTDMKEDFGDFPDIEKERLMNDLDLLYQSLDKFHSGMYWYTTKDSVDKAFEEVRVAIADDLNVLEFHKLIAPLVALSREGHTSVRLPASVNERVKAETRFLPLTFTFLGKKLYCVKNGSDFEDFALEGKQVESINGETPAAIVSKIGRLFASDGFIETVKYSDLEGFRFSRYYFYYYGQVDQFEIKFTEVEETSIVEPLRIEEIRKHTKYRYEKAGKSKGNDLLEYKAWEDSIAYLGIHSFSDSDINEQSHEKSLASFLEKSFKSIAEENIETLVVDVGKNGGGTEGNEGLLYSYFGEDYQKYTRVRAKTQKAILDNGVDRPILWKTLGPLERTFTYRKMDDGSLERKQGIGPGLRAYRKAPKHKYTGNVYVIIGPGTYSGGSEFSNMMYTNDLATFVGQETGGGYLGNTSGYSKTLVLPNSAIRVRIPTLQFVMNVAPTLPFGRGVLPHHEVVPTFEQYTNGENAPLQYILKGTRSGELPTAPSRQ